MLSEGSSLSARQSVTALGLAGHHIGVCDPEPLCIARFSRFVTHYYRVPPLGKDPWAYLNTVLGILSEGNWDVLFPTHEQAFLFSREIARIPPGIGPAVADFRSFLQIQGKVALVGTLERLSIPQPDSRVIRTRDELMRERRFPFYLKADYATASTGVWRIRGTEDASRAPLEDGQEFVVQEAAEGILERAQAVFDRGRLAAIHSYRQVLEGLGGGDIAKLSVRRSSVLHYVEQLGEALQWHGALSMDYILQNESPLFIDANPRLVEPMNATFSGVNLADILVRVSCGEAIAPVVAHDAGVRTHMLLMGLLSKRSRLDIVAELARAIYHHGPYAGSREELLPVRIDYTSLVPLLYAITRVLVNPQSAAKLSGGSVASYSLSPEAARRIAAQRVME